jgi:hypothetical protein
MRRPESCILPTEKKLKTAEPERIVFELASHQLHILGLLLYDEVLL